MPLYRKNIHYGFWKINDKYILTINICGVAIMKKLKTSLLIFFLIVTMFTCIQFNIPPAKADTNSVTFRPFYPGYQRGSKKLPRKPLVGESYSEGLIDREFNLEAWNINSMTLKITYFGDPTWSYYACIDLEFSYDGGNTWTHTYSLPDELLDFWNSPDAFDWPGGKAITKSYTIPPSEYQYYNASTRIRLRNRSDYYDVFLCVVYWGAGQKPVPPSDYIDDNGNYVQYYLWWEVEYEWEDIPFVASTKEFESDITKTRAEQVAQAILNTFHPSGAGNEVTDKEFGKDTWIVIYSSQLAARALINLTAFLPEHKNEYLGTVKRFLHWMWSKQNENGSFPFYLVDGDQHVFYYIHVDSFSALAITITWEYYQATNDNSVIDDYWENIKKCGTFLESLNSSYSLLHDSYYSNDNGTTWQKNEWALLHDVCEAYEGILHLSYIYDYKGDATNKAKYENWANQIKTAIDTYFWNETLKRYAGFFNVVTGEQDTSAVYSMITPVIYRVTTNWTRIKSTLRTYLDWGLMSGRYYNVTWDAPLYDAANEYSTMAGMIMKALGVLKNDFNSTRLFYKDMLNASKFLWENPIFSDGALFEPERGFLDWVNFETNEYAPDYARLVEASAWYLLGVMEYGTDFPVIELHAYEKTPTLAYEMSGYAKETDRIILLDSSKYKSYATTPSLTSAPSLKGGALGLALYFDGNDYLVVDSSENIQAFILFTISFWIQPSVFGTDQYILYKANEYGIYISEDRKICFFMYGNDGDVFEISSATKLDYNTWYFVVAELDGFNITIYIDHEKENSTLFNSETVAVTSNDLYIGSNGSSLFYRGLLDELQIYKCALEDNEKRTLSFSQIEAPQTYHFTEGSGDYGFYGNYFETPWANGTVSDSWVKTDHYLYGFAKFRSKITLRMDTIGSGDYVEWAFTFYKKAVKQVKYAIRLYRTASDRLEVRWYKNDQFITSDYFTFNQTTDKYYMAIEAWNDPSGKFGLRAIVYTDKQKTLGGSELVPSDDKGFREYFFTYEDAEGNVRTLPWFDALVRTTITVMAYGGFVGILEHESFPWLILIAILVVSVVAVGTIYYLAATGNPIAKAIVETIFQPIIDFLSGLAGQIAQALRPVGEWIISAFLGAMEPIIKALSTALTALWNWIVSGMDYLLSFTGNTHLFSDFINFIVTLATNIANAIIYIGTLITQAFTLIVPLWNTFVTILTNFVGTFISMWDKFVEVMQGGYGMMVDFYGMFEPVLPSILTLLAIGYVIWLIVLWEQKGLGAVIDHIKGVIDILSFVASIFLRVIQTLIHIITAILEAIPF